MDSQPLWHRLPHGSVVTLSTTRDSDDFVLVYHDHVNPPEENTSRLDVVNVQGLATHEQAHFRLRHHTHNGDPVVSLQHTVWGGYVSPGPDNSWTLRPHAREWEFLAESPAGACGEIVLHSRAEWGRSVADSKPPLCFDPRSGRCVQITESGPTVWRIKLALPPCIDITPLMSLREVIITCPSPAAATPGQPQRLTGLPEAAVRLIQQIGYVHKEISFFYVMGHGVGADAFQQVQQSIGPLPFKRDFLLGDEDRKANYALVVQREHHDPPFGTVRQVERHAWFPSTPDVADTALYLTASFTRCFEEKHRLAALLLHVLDHAQQMAQSPQDHPSPSWRSQIYPYSVLALRALAYHPGPLYTAEGGDFVTTAPHTDATWVTLLTTDQVGGLQVRRTPNSPWLDVPPIAGAILANTGNLLAAHSGGFYPAVCHRVVRVSERATRFSMPFFWDQEGSATGGC